MQKNKYPKKPRKLSAPKEGDRHFNGSYNIGYEPIHTLADDNDRDRD